MEQMHTSISTCQADGLARAILAAGGQVPRQVEVRPPHDGYHPITLWTDHGDVSCRHYTVAGTRRAVILIGCTEDWESPALGLYPRLCRDLLHDRVASLRLRVRNPSSLPESVKDVLAGAGYLAAQGVGSLALCGHGRCGAVAIQAAASAAAVRTVITLATQSSGTEAAARLGPRCSLLLVHGDADPVQAPFSSEYVYDLAREPKHLVIYQDAGHRLDEVSPRLTRLLHDWVLLHT